MNKKILYSGFVALFAIGQLFSADVSSNPPLAQNNILSQLTPAPVGKRATDQITRYSKPMHARRLRTLTLEKTITRKKTVSCRAYNMKEDGTKMSLGLARYNLNDGSLLHLETDKQHRGQGIGSLLLAEAKKDIKKEGIARQIDFFTFEESRKFYEKNGAKALLENNSPIPISNFNEEETTGIFMYIPLTEPCANAASD